MKISVGSDHRGYWLKEKLKEILLENGHIVDDVGCEKTESCDYPEFAQKVAGKVADNTSDRGILICGSGIGMSIAANRFLNVRAALCYNEEAAQLSRAHNDSNVLVLGANFVSPEKAGKILQAWLDTVFEQGRHQKRLNLIDNK